MGRHKMIVDIEKIINLYEVEKKSMPQIAKLLNVSMNLIFTRLESSGIKRRKSGNNNQIGVNNFSWKGKSATYKAFHLRVYTVRGRPQICSMCERKDRKRYDWANMTGKLYDIYDYVRLCRSCHSKFDDKIKNTKKK